MGLVSRPGSSNVRNMLIRKDTFGYKMYVEGKSRRYRITRVK
jgi:hypothetical protein